jgi:hypothetical protein
LLGIVASMTSMPSPMKIEPLKSAAAAISDAPVPTLVTPPGPLSNPIPKLPAPSIRSGELAVNTAIVVVVPAAAENGR